MDLHTLCYFAMVIQVSGRLILGNTGDRERKPTLLTTYNFSSLVMDYFHSGRQDVTVAGLYCDYPGRNEQTISNMLGALLKQLVGSGIIPEAIRQAFEAGKGHLGGVGP